MKLSTFSVERPVATVMFFSIVLLLGIVSLTRLALDLYPNLQFPVAVIITEYEGAGPEDVEQLVTRPIEEIVGSIQNVDTINSETSAGTSFVLLMFNWGTDMDVATLKIRERLDIVKAFMPDGVGNPLVFQMDPSMIPIMVLGMGGEVDQVRLKSIAENEIKNRLERVPGVASVSISGGLEREIQIIIDESRLNGYGLTIQQVVHALRTENFNMSAGYVEDGRREFLLRTIGEYQQVEDISQVLIPSQAGIIRLQDIAEIRDDFKIQRTINRLNGEPSVSIGIQKQSDANTVLVANRLHREIAKIQEDLSGNIQFGIMFDQSSFIKDSINTVARNIVVGGLFAVIVLYLFLRNMRSTSIIATAIPFSIISTFGLIYFSNQTLNLLTMGGLALGVGMMIDNSIVILENIYRHRQEGYSRIEAAKKGASEVAMAVTASTVTTIVVFLPIVFVQGFASQLFRPLAYVVAFSLVSSLVVALALVPMLSSKFLRVQEKERNGNGQEGRLDRLSVKYQAMLDWALNRRKRVIGLVVLAVVATFAMVPRVGMEFLPAMDAGEISIDARLAVGTVIEETDAVSRQIEDILMNTPEVDIVFATAGFTGSDMMAIGAAQTERTRIRVLLKKDRERTTAVVTEELREKLARLPGLETTVREVDPNSEGMGGGGKPISIEVRGDDLAVLEEIANQIADRIQGVEGVREVETSFEETRPQLQFNIDRQKAATFGITSMDLAQLIRAAVHGTVATNMRIAGEEIDIRVTLEDGVRTNLRRIESLQVASPFGMTIPVGELAQLEQVDGPFTITRNNNVRMGTVSADLTGRDLGSIMRDIMAATKDIPLAEGYYIEYGGQSQEMMESFRDLALALLLAIILVYMVMAAQFESLLHPFIIMFAMPTTFIGIVASLFITGRSLSVPAFIGVILLAGIVVNNAIVLVDYINTLRKRGMERNEAVALAGKVRLRPILMTASTTILALIPLALGIGEGAEAQAPMATVVVGGLMVSTVITLVLIPVMYTILDDLANKVKSKIFKTSKESPAVSGNS